MKKGLSLLAAAMIFGFVGCGGGGGSSADTTSVSTTQTGTFVDAPVAGLNYETSSGIKGVTDSQGHFTYKNSDIVTFKIGSVTLGKSVAHSIITPYEISQKPENIAYVLQNLDSDGNLENGIQIPQDIPNVNVDLNDLTSIENAVKTIKESLKDKYTFPNITFDEAKKNLQEDTLSMAYEKIDNVNGKGMYVKDFTPFNTPIEVDIEEIKIDLDKGRVLVYNPQEKKWFEGDYIEKYDDYTFKVIDKDDPNDIEYIRLYKVNGGYRIAKYDINTQEIQFESTYLMYDKDSLNSLIEAYSKMSDATRIIDIDGLLGKMFYQLDISSNGKLSTMAIKLNDGVVEKYFEEGKLTIDVTNNYDDEAYKFENGVFYNYDDENEEWDAYYLYKISLSGKTIDIQTLASESVFDAEKQGMVEYFENNNLPMKFTFTKGNIYCDLIWRECWLDKDGYEELINQINQ